MTGNQEDKYSMYLTVLAETDPQVEVWQGNGAFATAYAAFQEQVTIISVASRAQNAGIKGATAQKAAAREALSVAAVAVAAGLQAWAAVTGESQVGAETNFTASAFIYCRDGMVEPRARKVHLEATARVAELAGYGVTQGMLDALETAIGAYRTALVAPRGAITDRKAATAAMAAAFVEADRLLKGQLDKLATVIGVTNPDFARAFANARIIVNS